MRLGDVNRLVVIGSVNQDRVVRCGSLPRPGESVLATSVDHGFGGKGANQACAAARLEVPTHLIAAVGDDRAGLTAVQDIERYGVDVTYVRHLVGQPSGTADIYVDAASENFIVVHPGANAHLSASTVARAFDELAVSSDDVILTSAEITPAVIDTVAGLAVEADAFHVHNLAPFGALGLRALTGRGALIANELEALQATGIADPGDAAVALADGGTAVVTLGAEGALMAHSGRALRIPAPRVDAVDSTGAGDAFCGAFAAALCHGNRLEVAVGIAVRAGASAVRAAGARGSLPTWSELG